MNTYHIKLHTAAIRLRPRHAWFHLKGICREFVNEILLWRDMVWMAAIAASETQGEA